MTTISTDGALNNIYLQMSVADMQYSVGSTPGSPSWITISAANWPVTITNNNPSSTSILDVIVTQALTISNTYGSVSGYFIIGTEYITMNGADYYVTITDVPDYPGLIQNGTSVVNGQANVIVKNFNMNTNASGISTTASAAGWLCQTYFGKGVSNISIENNTNSGDIIGSGSGGIAGGGAGIDSGSVTFTNCTNSGLVRGFGAGGIAGGYAGSDNGSVTFIGCTNNGDIRGVIDFYTDGGIAAGGIAGNYVASRGSAILMNCLNTGVIIGMRAGGIVGEKAGFINNLITISKCGNTGSVNGIRSGGIAGGKFAENAVDKVSNISDCYNTGDVNALYAGGICGGSVGYYSKGTGILSVNITNCYSLGNISDTCGGICGGFDNITENPYITNPIITITNTYSYGNVYTGGSGIVALSLPFRPLEIDTYVANGFWSDADAKASLTIGTTPIDTNTGNPGSVWTTLSTSFSPNIPYILSAFNAQLFTPDSASSDVNFSTQSVTSQPGFNYLIISADQTNNVIPTYVVSYKGISPYYYSYNISIFTFTNTNGIPGEIYVALGQSTGVLNYTLPVNNDPHVIQIPDPFNPYAASQENIGEVIYTDTSYIIVPDISSNPTYILSTDITNRTFDVFQDSTTIPAAFIPNSLLIGNNLIAPSSIVIDSAGNFYVGNSSYNIISVYDSNGIFLRTIAMYSAVNVPLLKISFMTIDESNNLYVTCESNTGVYVVPAGSNTNNINATILKYIYGNDLRGLTFNENYLYIVKQSAPKYVIKYNLTNNKYLEIPFTSASPAIPVTSQPNAIVYNNITSSPTLYITTINGSNNRIYSLSNITGTETITGGTGAALISSNTSFLNNEYPYSITIDNSANLYVGLDEGRILPVNVNSVGKIARITPTGTISNRSYLTYNGLGIGRPLGLLFNGDNNLYVTDIIHDRVIRSRPKKFVFGPAVLNADAFYVKDPLLPTNVYKTYLYDVTNSIIETSFTLYADCFQKGTRILCENDVYVPIENIKIGDLVKTYKHGYQKVILCKTTRSCDYVRNSKNQIHVYKKESNPDLTEDLYLTGGHSLLLDALSETELKNMKETLYTDLDLMVEDKYKLMCCFNRQIEISPQQNVELYRFTLEPPENAKPSHVYGIWANGILSESNSVVSMEN